jgi:hypothetical protein
MKEPAALAFPLPYPAAVRSSRDPPAEYENDTMKSRIAVQALAMPSVMTPARQRAALRAIMGS